MAGGIEAVAASVSVDLVCGVCRDRIKKQREELSLLVATMLDAARAANLMDLSASLPRESERIDMRYQWISRLLGNALIDTDLVMVPFASDVMQRAEAHGRRVILIIDQSKANDTQQAIVVAARVGGRSSSLRGRRQPDLAPDGDTA
jgi:hypothetical protein